MKYDRKKRLLYYLLNQIKKSELIKFCGEKGLKKSGIKDLIINRIIESCIYEEILELTKNVTIWTTLSEFKWIQQEMGDDINTFLEKTNRYGKKVKVETLRQPLSYSAGRLGNIIGELGELLAIRYLVKNGFTVCEFPSIGTAEIPGKIHFPRIEAVEAEPSSFSPVDSISRKIDATELGICSHILCTKNLNEVKNFCKSIIKRIYCPSTYGTDSDTGCPCTLLFPRICHECDKLNQCPVFEIFNIQNTKDVGTDYCVDFIAHKDGKHYLVEVKTNRRRSTIKQAEFIKKMKKYGFNALLLDVKIPFDLIESNYL